MLVYEYAIYIFITILLHIGVLVLLKRKRKRSLQGRHVVVTGGSSGIGLWVAVYAAQLGAHVTIIARNKERLDEADKLIRQNSVDLPLGNAKKQAINYKSFDLASCSYRECCEMLDEIDEKIPIQYLVNCAGMAICGKIEDTSIEDAHKMMDLNYFGTYYPTRHCLEKMKKRGVGTIVITASQAALMGIYGYGAYGAAKFALRGLAETIAMEAKQYGVSVTLALPADTDTPGFAEEEKTKPKETKIISGSGGLANPKDVAIQILNDAMDKKFFSISGIESWVLTIMCSGMAPWGGLLMKLWLLVTIVPTKIIGMFIQWSFQRIVRQCAEEEWLKGDTDSAAKDESKSSASESVRPTRKMDK